MVAAAKEYQTVADLMYRRSIGIEDLVRSTGICQRIVKAIADQYYTPSPQQRELISSALHFPRDRIIWGHRIPAEDAQIRP